MGQDSFDLVSGIHSSIIESSWNELEQYYHRWVQKADSEPASGISSHVTVILCKRHQIKSSNSSSSFRLVLLVDLGSLVGFDRVVVCDRKISIFSEGFDSSNRLAWYYIKLPIYITPHHSTFPMLFPRPLQALLPGRFSPICPFHASSKKLSAKLHSTALVMLARPAHPTETVESQMAAMRQGWRHLETFTCFKSRRPRSYT